MPCERMIGADLPCPKNRRPHLVRAGPTGVAGLIPISPAPTALPYFRYTTDTVLRWLPMVEWMK